MITVVSEDCHHVDAISYGYDGLNRLTQADGTTDHTYAYDRSGNLTSKDGTARTYNAANQLTAIGNRNLTYDANGNLTSDGTNTYTWDRANRLTQVGNTTYIYDGLGNRVSQTVNTTKTDYLLDLQAGLPKVLAATTGTNTERYIHAIRGLHATEDSNGDWAYALEDALGSVRGTIGSGRQFQSTHNYDPYGNPDTTITGFAFTGEPRDANGLQYHRARYYHPSLAIFPSLDPFEGTIHRPMSLNGYAYVEGNVPNRTDPTGMASRVRSLTQGGSVIRPPAVKTSRMRNSLVCRTSSVAFRGSTPDSIDLTSDGTTPADPIATCEQQCFEENQCARIGFSNPACRSLCRDKCKYYDCGDMAPGSAEHRLCSQLVEARQCASQSAPIDHFFSVENVLHTINSNRGSIEQTAREFDVPSSLIAGVLAAEMFWDYEGVDSQLDDILRRVCDVTKEFPDIGGPGKANVHGGTYNEAQSYLESLGYAGERLGEIGNPCNLVTTTGAIEAVGVVTRYILDDYGHGKNLSAEDMALIFAAYRQGAQQIADPDNDVDFSNWISRGRDLPGNGCFALPFMTYMQQQFGNN